jgi:L-rhamnose mutarotase
MKLHVSRLASLTLALIVGVLLGYVHSESEHHTTGNAMAAGADEEAMAKPIKVQRFGRITGLRPEMKDRYNELHAHPWPEINAMIRKCNIHNYSLYEIELNGQLCLFSYYEYTGDDFKADMAKMAADPKTQEWRRETFPCMMRLPGTPEGEQWIRLPEVYHLD